MRKTEFSVVQFVPPGVVSPVLNGGEELPSFTRWQRSSWCSTGCYWLPWLPGHIAGSCLTCYSPGPRDPFLSCCILVSCSPKGYWCMAYSFPVQDIAFPFAELHEMLAVHSSRLLRSLWIAAHTSGLSSPPPSFVSSSNLPVISL